jgi:Cutinase/PKD domain/von Willebrand factor type A domain
MAISIAVLCMTAGKAVADSGCPDYIFIGARGSGESYDASHPIQSLGSPVAATYNALVSDLSGSAVRIVADPVPNPPYPAKGVFGSLATDLTGISAGLGLPVGYHDSVDKIEPWVDQEIATQSSACPDAKFILSGYSQGAQGVADSLQRDINPAVVLGAAFFGDPYFNGKSAGDWGSFDPGRNGVLGVRPKYASSIASKVFSYCHGDDPVCQGIEKCTIICVPQPVHFDRHTDYPDGDPTKSDTDLAAGQLARLVRDDQAARGTTIPEPPAPPISGPLDLAFAIDSTGSMGDIIDQVKSNVTNIVNQLQAADPDFRVGLVDYKDAEPYSDDSYQAQVDQPLSTDIEGFDTAVDALSAEGGGDTPESVYTGMMTALGLDWRDGAHKEMIVIGDAPGHDPDPVTGYTAADVIQKALALDPVAINVLPANSDADATFGPVAQATGGADISSADDAAAAIESTIQSTQTAPVAGLGGPYDGFTDQPITLSAAASYSPQGRALTFGWDFNADGTIDETTTNPTVEHTFADGYDGLVTVTVTDSDGQSAVAQAQVHAAGNTPAAPGTPSTPQLAAGDGQITATWTPASAGGPTDLYILEDATGTQMGTLVPSGSGPQTMTLTGLPDGQPLQVQVVAVNAGGSAVSGLSNTVTPGPTVPTTPTTPTTPTNPTPLAHVAGRGFVSVITTGALQAKIRLAIGTQILRRLATHGVGASRRVSLKPGRYTVRIARSGSRRRTVRIVHLTVTVGRLTVLELRPNGAHGVAAQALKVPAVRHGGVVLTTRGVVVRLASHRTLHLKAGSPVKVALGGKGVKASIDTGTTARRQTVTVRAGRLTILVAVAGDRWRAVTIPLP